MTYKEIAESAFADELEKIAGIKITAGEVASNLEAAGIKGFGEKINPIRNHPNWHSESVVNERLGRTSTPAGRPKYYDRTQSVVMGEKNLTMADVEKHKADYAQAQQIRKNVPMAKDTTPLGTPDISKYSEFFDAAFIDELEKMAAPVNAAEVRGVGSWLSGLFRNPAATQEVRQAVVSGMRAPGRAAAKAVTVAPAELAAARQSGQGVVSGINQAASTATTAAAAPVTGRSVALAPRPVAPTAAAPTPQPSLQVMHGSNPELQAVQPGLGNKTGIVPTSNVQHVQTASGTALAPGQGVMTASAPAPTVNPKDAYYKRVLGARPVEARVESVPGSSPAGNSAGGTAPGTTEAESISKSTAGQNQGGALALKPQTGVAQNIERTSSAGSKKGPVDTEFTVEPNQPAATPKAPAPWYKTIGGLAGAGVAGVGAGALMFGGNSNQNQYQYRG